MKTRWIEFFIVSGIYLFLLINIAHNIDESEGQSTIQAHALTIYIAVSTYLLYIYPALFSREKMVKWVFALIILFLSMFSLFITIENWRPLPSRSSIPPFALSGIITFALLIYTALKAATNAIREITSDESILAKTTKEFLISLAIGLGILLLVTQAHVGLGGVIGYAIPFSYVLFAFHYHYLLPYLNKFGVPKIIHVVVSLLATLVAIALFSSLMEITVGLIGFRAYYHDGLNILFCFILGAIISPASSVLYYHQLKQQKQIIGLQKKLSHTSSDLKLLQSQINPHFLFNAMNTLYGIALRENADRTATGIQKLSDMMRFILHENQQESILLAREITYIEEYVDLQKLRIADLPSIQITMDLPDGQIDDHQISPMLLIPFIENAFKHGISLNKPSWIRIQLYVQKDILKLNVYNSIHKHNESDPEKYKSGIGLENVKNRLNLLYPERHQLHIEETNTEFFVFLTLQINTMESAGNQIETK